ncbi:F-box domain-containing protein [Diplocarpon rosae]|nr:F-box domain-containing protein [Diplocarpon rosae]
MRSPPPSMAPLETENSYRPTTDTEGDSQSSSSNSPARAEYEESDFYGGNNDSQSSIGVPTFQDMAVTEECTTASNRLPAEVLIGIFSKLSSPQDLLSCLLVSKKWAKNSVDLLWHRPSSQSCSDGSVLALQQCNRIERLTLTGCKGLTDSGISGLLKDSKNLLALDISGVYQVTETSIYALAAHCHKLQGLNITGCTKISNQSMIAVAEACNYLKRLKLNNCEQLDDSGIMAFAVNCPNILEIDLHQCRLITNGPVTALIQRGQALRELRLAHCELISDEAFMPLSLNKTFEHLRILDLTSCARLTDQAVEKIIEVAPRLRNLVFAKCRNLSDHSVNAISKLGKNLHFLHLGHCSQITDGAVKKLVQYCNRIRYIDLGCCINLTDDSVIKLATLPKLRRIGLVKCSNITNKSVYALAQSTHRYPRYRISHGDLLEHTPASSLERVHLSYCTNLTLNSIVVLLNNCQKLTHLSLTGVQSFLRSDLEQFCREAPAEFTEHQRNVFCVFSGMGVMGLRNHLNSLEASEGGYDPMIDGPLDDDDDQTMTGMGGTTAMMGATILGDDEDGDGDEELEEVDGQT